jgi:hypothetical protein
LARGSQEIAGKEKTSGGLAEVKVSPISCFPVSIAMTKFDTNMTQPFTLRTGNWFRPRETYCLPETQLPTKDQHIKKAERNEVFAEFLATKTKYLDWAVTVLFYAALHYIDAILAVSLADPEDHKERKAQMAVNDTTRRVYREYRLIETVSWNSRYFAMPIEAEDWNKVKPEFDALRGHIRSRLGLKP